MGDDEERDHGWPRVVTTAAGLLALGLVILLAYALPRGAFPSGAGRALFALGFLLFGGMVAGQLAAILRLPRLTGFLIAGMVAGPYGVAVFSPQEVRSLELINALALALIALQAGGEFTFVMLRRGWRSLFYASLTQVLVLGPALVGSFAAMAAFLPFTEGLSTGALLALGAVWSAIGVSKSPAATLAVLTETHAKGPLANYAMALAVVFDVVVLVLFAVAMMFARMALEPGATVSLRELGLLGEELLASVAAGTTFGLLVAGYFWVVKREQMLFLVVLAYGVTAFCRYFRYDTLLVFVIAGFIVQNFSRQGPALIRSTEKLAGAVMVVFFATAGASLDLAALRNSWQVAALLVVTRWIFTIVACRAGHALAKDPPSVTRYGHTSLVSQAGVTIGLLAIVAEKLPGEIGTGLASLGIAVVGINQIVGPVMFKWGLAKAGEIPDGKEPPPEPQGEPATTPPIAPPVVVHGGTPRMA